MQQDATLKGKNALVMFLALYVQTQLTKQFTFNENHCSIMLHLAPLCAECFLTSYPFLASAINYNEKHQDILM
jgi:hypothetical protein